MIPTHIIIHHSLTKDSDTVSWQAIRRYHMEELGWNDTGYHAGIELVAGRFEILLGRMPTVPGAHCKEEGMNYKALGICCVGNFDLQSDVDIFVNRGGFDLAVRLVRSWCEIMRIPPTNVKRHSDYAPYKSCPGKAFPWTRFLGAIGA